MLPSFAYKKAESIEEALEQLKNRNARIHAGGTDL